MRTIDADEEGFSLVELSIVLVILGLLTGGVLTGQSLIRAAELRSVVSDYQRYATAVRAFRERYRELPGDMPNATDFWGMAGGTTGRDMACYNVASTDARTCNGNGNGRLYLSDNVSDSSAPEWYRAWQHLANAGLVGGTYTGKADSAPRLATPGKNIPAGRIANTGFTLMSYRAEAADPEWWSGDYDGFAFGGSVGSVGVESLAPTLTPQEAWNIDTKLDDGNPAHGRVRSYKLMTSCNSTSDPATAQYEVTATSIACGLFLAMNDPGN